MQLDPAALGNPREDGAVWQGPGLEAVCLNFFRVVYPTPWKSLLLLHCVLFCLLFLLRVPREGNGSSMFCITVITSGFNTRDLLT